MQRSTGCRAFSIGSPLFHLPTKHVAQPQVSAGQLKRIQRIQNFLLYRLEMPVGSERSA